jgi:flagellar biosynthesis regulator FlaF
LDLIKATNDIKRVLAALDRPQELKKFIDVADAGKLRDGKDRVVIECGYHHYQVWHKWIADRYHDGEYVYSTEGD